MLSETGILSGSVPQLTHSVAAHSVAMHSDAGRPPCPEREVLSETGTTLFHIYITTWPAALRFLVKLRSVGIVAFFPESAAALAGGTLFGRRGRNRDGGHPNS